MTGYTNWGKLPLPPAAIGAIIALSVIVAYWPFMGMPMISDTYLQIALARDYGGPEGWRQLAEDPLYRCRATSLLFTYLVDLVAGPSAFVHRAANIGLHLVNSVLLLWLFWRTPWRWAAVIFAACEVHQEAVIWVAALPELLVFTFLVLGLGAWMRAVKTGAGWAFSAAFICFLLALASKESGVVFVPLAALIWLGESEPSEGAKAWWSLLAMAGVSFFYALIIITTGNDHLHLTDGTFSLRAPFLKTEFTSIVRILTPFGFVAAAILWMHGQARTVGTCLLWMFITLLPYAFLLYMPRVPSRHTYIASAGLAVLIAAAAQALWNTRRRWLGPALVGLFLAQNLHWLWTRKYEQYARRAISTQKFLDFATQSPAPVRVECAPYGIDIYRSAARVVLNRPPELVLHAQERPEVRARSFCDPVHP